MFNKKTIDDIELQNKKVLVRVDFNVPIKNGKVMDDTRIIAALPTIEYLIGKGSAVILCSHLGRPKGKIDLDFSLRPVAVHLSQILHQPISFADDCIGEAAELAAQNLQPGQVLLLENTRFHSEEMENDPIMAQKLARLADIFVNDAFGTAHRAHASTEGVAHYLPAVAGRLMEKEIEHLGNAISNPKHPFIAILGGAKISDKIGVIENLLSHADQILIGGGMANTFFKAQNIAVGDSLVEDDVIEIARGLMQRGGEKLYLPVDIVIADQFTADAQSKVIPTGDVDAGWRILDIGPETIKNYREIISIAGTVVWNGPMGVFEFPEFAKGTNAIAKAVADSNAISVVGGGESAAAIMQSGVASQITHISTGGGASLEMLEGKPLPGLSALLDK
ncbi:MAG: phosphoglycerate kinase [Anaerolineaceae bacterium]|nr:phosphoglycerate kinase [Anaerolineaceae bacterium]